MKSRNYFAILVLLVLTSVQITFATPLDDYVAEPDTSYKYTVVNTVKGLGYTAYILDMQSQTWRKSSEVDRTIWQHWLTIIKPDITTANKALLWINGGRNGGSPPSSADLMLAGIALNTKAVVADLKMVPNEPLTFPDGGGPRSEDAIIAYTFNKYMATGDETWPLLLPMVKSAVRAMDTIHSHLSSVTNGTLDINHFVVSGGSKRGWTTWLTAAADKRVIAITPAVIDVLNMDEQMKHHYSAYGFYSNAIRDYEEMKIFQRLDTPQGQALVKFIDPYEYRSRYTMPKFGVNSTGDQFFLPDSAQFYFKDLTGEKYLRYVPNTDHGLANSDAPMSLTVFFKSILAASTRPKFSWTIEDDSIVVKTVTTPTVVNLWQASNTKARDFRLETIGPAWKSSPLSDQGDGTYAGKVPEPNEGWTAFFVELTFDSEHGIPYKFTTQVHVVPKCLPFSYKLGFDTDCDVDLADLAILFSYWLQDEPSVDISPLCGNGIIDFLDYTSLAAEWKPSGQPPVLVLKSY
jgi:PhoPQ-activated pathogenicity-related protein